MRPKVAAHGSDELRRRHVVRHMCLSPSFAPSPPQRPPYPVAHITSTWVCVFVSASPPRSLRASPAPTTHHASALRT